MLKGVATANTGETLELLSTVFARLTVRFFFWDQPNFF